MRKSCIAGETHYRFSACRRGACLIQSFALPCLASPCLALPRLASPSDGPLPYQKHGSVARDDQTQSAQEQNCEGWRDDSGRRKVVFDIGMPILLDGMFDRFTDCVGSSRRAGQSSSELVSSSRRWARRQLGKSCDLH